MEVIKLKKRLIILLIIVTVGIAVVTKENKFNHKQSVNTTKILVTKPSKFINEDIKTDEAFNNKAYNLQKSIDNGDIARISYSDSKGNEISQKIYNVNNLDSFIENYKNEKKGKVRIVDFASNETGTWINKLCDLEYDGKQIIFTGYDTYLNPDKFIPWGPQYYAKVGKTEYKDTVRYSLVLRTEDSDANGAGLMSFRSSDIINNKEKSSNASTSKEAVVIRAEGISKFGNIIVTPNNDENIGELGADSSYGKSSDYTFNADYNIIFEDSLNNKKIIGKIEHQNIPIIIQPKNTPIKMEKITLNENELFIFIPQYAGSNDVPLYIFSVDKNGKASQVKFQFDNGSEPSVGATILTSTSPKFTLPSVEENMLVFKALFNEEDSSDLKFYKLTFKLNNNVLLLTSKTLLN